MYLKLHLSLNGILLEIVNKLAYGTVKDEQRQWQIKSCF